MKKIVLITLCLLLVITGCKKSEEENKNYGDILEEKTNTLSLKTEYNMGKYHLDIESNFEGQPYNNSIFSFLVNDLSGMYLLSYNKITNDFDESLYLDEIIINNKTYKYYIYNNTVYLDYQIDDNYHLLMMIKSLNNSIDEIPYELLDNFMFNVKIK